MLGRNLRAAERLRFRELAHGCRHFWLLAGAAATIEFDLPVVASLFEHLDLAAVKKGQKV